MYHKPPEDGGSDCLPTAVGKKKEKEKKVGSLCDCIAFKLSEYITLIVLHLTNQQHDYDLHFNSNTTKQLLNPFLEKHW